jgi:putative transcriptional regulator
MFEAIDVKSVRQKLNLTQAALAEKLGVDQGTVSNWENGKNSPNGPAHRLMVQMLDAKKASAA